MKIRLYHTSDVAVAKPDIYHSRSYLDFGKGFYATSLREQAEKYADRFIRRHGCAFLSVYELELDINQWQIKKFESYDKEWLDYISCCRKGLDVKSYDLIIGGVADDNVVLTIERYFNGEITKEFALGELKYEKPNNQYCFCSQQLLEQCLTHIESIKYDHICKNCPPR